MVKKTDIKGVIEELTEEMEAYLEEFEDTRDLPAILVNGPHYLKKLQATLNERELVSLSAAICWAAANSNVSEAVVIDRVETHYERLMVEEIAPNHFTGIIKYLVDFKESIN